MIVCMLGACGSDNAEKTYGGYTTDELHTEATDSLSNIQNYIALVDSCGGYDSYEKSVKEFEDKAGMRRGGGGYLQPFFHTPPAPPTKTKNHHLRFS